MTIILGNYPAIFAILVLSNVDPDFLASKGVIPNESIRHDQDPCW